MAGRRRWHSGSRLLVLLLLLAGYAVTLLAAWQVRQQVLHDAVVHFGYDSERTAQRIGEQLHADGMAVQAGSGLFDATGEVSRQQWQAYFRALLQRGALPDVQGVTFARHVPGTQLAAHIAQVRAEGFPRYTVFPPGERDAYAAVVYLEPFHGRNLRAFGYDGLSEPVRREALQQARDSGQAVMTGKVRLEQEDGVGEQDGVLVFSPVYLRGMPVDTVAQRRAALVGWVCIAYRMQDFIGRLLQGLQAEFGLQVALSVYDGRDAVPEARLFTTANAAPNPQSPFYRQQQVDYYGRPWLLVFDRPGRLPAVDYLAAWLVLAGGLLVSSLLAGLILSLARTREDARRIAERLTSDIQRSHQQLQESEQRWAFALEGSSLGVWDWRIPEDQWHESPRLRELLGLSHEWLDGQFADWLKRVHPDDRAGLQAAIQACQDGLEPHFEHEHRVRRGDGEYQWMLARGMVVVRDAGGDALRMLGTYADTSARKALEQSLRDSRAELLEAQRIARQGHWSLDLASSRIDWSEQVFHMFGLDPQEPAPSLPEQEHLLTPPSWQRMSSALVRVLDTGQPCEMEIEIIRRDGSHGWLLLRVEAVRGVDGAIKGLRGILADISSRRALEQSLRDSQADLLAAQRIARVGSWLLDIASGQVTWTEQLFRMLGIDPAQGVPPFAEHHRLFTPESWHRLSQAMAHTVAAGEPYEETLQTVRADGSHGWMLARGEAVRGEDGGVLAVRGVALDITEHREALARVERLSHLYAALSACNTAILRCHSREELFSAACRVAVEHAGVAMAWIGLLDAASGRIEPVQSFGAGTEYLDAIDISVLPGSPHGHGPSGIAVREGRPVWLGDFGHSLQAAPWRERAARYGWQASAALPLRCGGTVIGVLNFHSVEAGWGDAETRALLEEMAADISYALDKFAAEADAQHQEARLLESEQRFRALIEQSIAGAYIVQDDRFVYVNPRLARMLGYPDNGEGLIGRHPEEIIVGSRVEQVRENVRRLQAGEITCTDLVFTARRRDGSTIEVGTNSSLASYQQRRAVIGLMQDMSDRKVAEDHVRRYVTQLEGIFMQTVGLATTLSEMRDPYTAGHEQRVAEIAVAIGTEMGLDAHALEGLRVGGYLHDVGKMRVPTDILAKPGRLTESEYALVKEHARAGYEVLKDVEFPWPVAQIALQHHERFDGTGYPQGLRGDGILLEARITAVADVVESMASHRPYRPGLGLAAALAEIERGRGTAYDPAVADACLRLFRDKGYAITE